MRAWALAAAQARLGSPSRAGSHTVLAPTARRTATVAQAFHIPDTVAEMVPADIVAAASVDSPDMRAAAHIAPAPASAERHTADTAFVAAVAAAGRMGPAPHTGLIGRPDTDSWGLAADTGS